MFKLRHMVLVADPVDALESEAGFFEVTAPTGETMDIRLENGYIRIQSNFCCPAKMRADQLWQIVKVGELDPTDGESIQTEGEPGLQIQ